MLRDDVEQAEEEREEEEGEEESHLSVCLLYFLNLLFSVFLFAQAFLLKSFHIFPGWTEIT